MGDEVPGFEMLGVAEWVATNHREWLRREIRQRAWEATTADVDDIEQMVYETIMRSRLKGGNRLGWVRRVVAGAVGEWLRDESMEPSPKDGNGDDGVYRTAAERRRVRQLLDELDPDDDGTTPYRELEDF
jgi:hypothetical protein